MMGDNIGQFPSIVQAQRVLLARVWPGGYAWVASDGMCIVLCAAITARGGAQAGLRVRRGTGRHLGRHGVLLGHVGLGAHLRAGEQVVGSAAEDQAGEDAEVGAADAAR